MILNLEGHGSFVVANNIENVGGGVVETHVILLILSHGSASHIFGTIFGTVFDIKASFYITLDKGKWFEF